MHDGIARVAGGEQHLEIGRRLARFLGELATVHAAGQADIGEEHGHIGMGFQHLKRGASIAAPRGRDSRARADVSLE